VLDREELGPLDTEESLMIEDILDMFRGGEVGDLSKENRSDEDTQRESKEKRQVELLNSELLAIERAGEELRYR